MNPRSIVLLASAAVLLSLSSVAQTKPGSAVASLPATHTAVRPDALRWTPMSSELMEGTPAFALPEPPQVSLLEGDPSQAGSSFETSPIPMATFRFAPSGTSRVVSTPAVPSFGA